MAMHQIVPLADGCPLVLALFSDQIGVAFDEEFDHSVTRVGVDCNWNEAGCLQLSAGGPARVVDKVGVFYRALVQVVVAQTICLENCFDFPAGTVVDFRVVVALPSNYYLDRQC